MSPTAPLSPQDTPSPSSERLAKFMAQCGVASRREAERMICQGDVTVDGVPILTPAFFVEATQVVCVKGVPVVRLSRPRLWALYKKEGLMVTHHDPEGRPTVFDTLPDDFPRVISVGRLDLNSEGLLLLTNEARLAHYAETPKLAQWSRYYRVRVFGKLCLDSLNRLKQGITLEGISYAPIHAEVDRTQGQNTWLYLTLSEGKNREIRKIMTALGLQVNRLIRVAYGPFQIGSRKPGDLWEIPFHEFSSHFPFLQKISSDGTLSRSSPKKPLRNHKGLRGMEFKKSDTKPKQERKSSPFSPRLTPKHPSRDDFSSPLDRRELRHKKPSFPSQTFRPNPTKPSR